MRALVTERARPRAQQQTYARRFPKVPIRFETRTLLLPGTALFHHRDGLGRHIFSLGGDNLAICIGSTPLGSHSHGLGNDGNGLGDDNNGKSLRI